jgi:hypothetical protein
MPSPLIRLEDFPEPALRKLSAPLMGAVYDLGATPDAPLSLLVQVQGALGFERRGRIEALGGAFGSEVGDVVTLAIPLQHLAALAALDFVVALELASPLFPESAS